jgi:rare lipoprotein A
MTKHLTLPALAGITLFSTLVPALADIGHASFYGRELAGRKTASGEIFRPEGMTAAHRSLPLGTKVKVTNLANGKAVVLRINDRGPFVRGRMLDVSHGAARVLGFASAGTARVKIERLGSMEASAPVGAPLALPTIPEPQNTLPEGDMLRNPAGNGN